MVQGAMECTHHNFSTIHFVRRDASQRLCKVLRCKCLTLARSLSLDDLGQDRTASNCHTASLRFESRSNYHVVFYRQMDSYERWPALKVAGPHTTGIWNGATVAWILKMVHENFCESFHNLMSLRKKVITELSHTTVDQVAQRELRMPRI